MRDIALYTGAQDTTGHQHDYIYSSNPSYNCALPHVPHPPPTHTVPLPRDVPVTPSTAQYEDVDLHEYLQVIEDCTGVSDSDDKPTKE